MKREQAIVSRLLWVVGLYQKIFGKDSELFLYKREKEENKNTLKEVFQYRDIDKLFPKELDEKRVEKMTRIFFTFAWDEEKKSIFSKSE